MFGRLAGTGFECFTPGLFEGLRNELSRYGIGL